MTTEASGPDLSIVLPAYNEESRLPRCLDRLAAYIEHQRRTVEVLVVDNGSTDGTARIAEDRQATLPYVRLLRLPEPGKGRAVREGMLAATGRLVMFCDVDFSMPIETLDEFTALLDAGAPIVIASRELATSTRHDEPTGRHVMGRVFNYAVRILVLRGIDDTQCGFKAFQRDVARDLFGRQRLHGWAFDVEILFLARKRGYRVQQLAIDWYYDADTRVRGARDSLTTFVEMARIRLNDLVGRYG